MKREAVAFWVLGQPNASCEEPRPPPLVALSQVPSTNTGKALAMVLDEVTVERDKALIDEACGDGDILRRNLSPSHGGLD